MLGIDLPDLLIFFIPAIAGALIARSKGRTELGWFVVSGLFWFPILILLFLPPAKEVEGKYKECPKCKEFIKWHASVCKHCNYNIGNT